MLDHSASRPKSTDSISENEWNTLHDFLERSWNVKPEANTNSASLARTTNGIYYSGKMRSHTHLLTIPSELGALVQATSHLDASVHEIITLTQDKHFLLNGESIISNHASRTHLPIRYRVYTLDGKKILDKTIPPAPNTNSLAFLKKWTKGVPWRDVSMSISLEKQLAECARQGMNAHFGVSDGFSRYGACIRAGNKLYWSGVYSNPDERIGLHAEMSATILAMMDENTKIEDVAIISDKFVDRPAAMCGACRQFLMEIQQKNENEIKVFAYALNSETPTITTLNELLPGSWSPKQK
jgi:cytidine deaminase